MDILTDGKKLISDVAEKVTFIIILYIICYEESTNNNPNLCFNTIIKICQLFALLDPIMSVKTMIIRLGSRLA